MSSGLIYWNEQVVYGPIRRALPTALRQTAALADSLAASQGLKHADVKVTQVGDAAVLRPSDPKAVFFEGGTRPHTEQGGGGFMYLATLGIFRSGQISHPGMAPRPFLHPAADSFPEIFIRNARLAFGRF